MAEVSKLLLRYRLHCVTACMLLKLAKGTLRLKFGIKP